jgi:hypothetical protein
MISIDYCSAVPSLGVLSRVSPVADRDRLDVQDELAFLICFFGELWWKKKLKNEQQLE